MGPVTTSITSPLMSRRVAARRVAGGRDTGPRAAIAAAICTRVMADAEEPPEASETDVAPGLAVGLARGGRETPGAHASAVATLVIVTLICGPCDSHSAPLSTSKSVLSNASSGSWLTSTCTNSGSSTAGGTRSTSTSSHVPACTRARTAAAAAPAAAASAAASAACVVMVTPPPPPPPPTALRRAPPAWGMSSSGRPASAAEACGLVAAGLSAPLPPPSWSFPSALPSLAAAAALARSLAAAAACASTTTPGGRELYSVP